MAERHRAGRPLTDGPVPTGFYDVGIAERSRRDLGGWAWRRVGMLPVIRGVRQRFCSGATTKCWHRTWAPARASTWSSRRGQARALVERGRRDAPRAAWTSPVPGRCRDMTVLCHRPASRSCRSMPRTGSAPLRRAGAPVRYPQGRRGGFTYLRSPRRLSPVSGAAAGGGCDACC